MKSRLFQVWLWTSALVLLVATVASASRTYKPPLPPQLNKAYLAGEKLWASKKLVGPGGQTCAACHDKKRGEAEPLDPLKLLSKRNDLSKLIYFELVTHSRNNVVQPDGPEVKALETYIAKRYKLDNKAPAARTPAEEEVTKARDDYLQGDYSSAVRRLEMALNAELAPNSEAEARLLLGVIAHVLGDNLRARAEFRQVFQLQPETRLDPEIFSPKTLELFEAVRSSFESESSSREED